MYLPAFPAIARDFGVDIAAVQYTLAIYNVGLATGAIALRAVIQPIRPQG